MTEKSTPKKAAAKKSAVKRGSGLAPDVVIDPSKPLKNSRHERFVLRMVQGMTQRQAYAEAFGTPMDDKDRSGSMTIDRKAWVMMRRREVAARIEYLRTEMANNIISDGSRIMRELAEIATVSAADLFGDDGEMLPVTEWPPRLMAAVSSVEVDEYGKIRVRLWDKLSAIDKIAKNLGLYKVDNEQKSDPVRELAQAIVSSASVVSAGGLKLPDE